MNIVNFFLAIPLAFREQLLIWKLSKKATSSVTRFYIYSIVLDPFLFFVIFDRLSVGFSLTLSRGFQVIFYVFLIIHFIGLKKKSDVVVLNKYWDFLFIFIIYLIGIYSVGMLLGFNFIFKNLVSQTDTSTVFAEFLSSSSVRPFIEFFVLILTLFHYFWIGPRVVKTKENFQFLCSSLLLLCYISLTLGLINFISALIFNQNLLPRHIAEYFYDAPSYSGVRFQGLAGEPRDAFGQLVMFIVIFYFFYKIHIVKLKKHLNKNIMLISLFALMLTFSASGVVGFGIFIAMYFVYNLSTRFTLKKLLTALAVVVFGIAIIIAAVFYVERFAMYVDTFKNIFSLIDDSEELPYMVLTQLNNFYPLIYWIKSCMGESLGVCFFGGGLGTSFALNSKFYTEGISNPHSYISRLLPELGIVGIGFFIFLLLSPIFKQISQISNSAPIISPLTVRIIKISLLFLMAAVLGHKSNNLYLGLLIISLGLHFLNQKFIMSSAKANF
jgi:hypothetical protein